MSPRRWRLVSAVVVGAIVFLVVVCVSRVFGSNTGSQSTTASLVCQAAPITLTWRTATSSDAQTRVSRIEIGGIDAACNGQTVMLATYDSGMSLTGLFRTTLTTGDAIAVEYFDGVWKNTADGGGPLAANVHLAQIVFDGPWTNPNTVQTGNGG